MSTIQDRINSQLLTETDVVSQELLAAAIAQLEKQKEEEQKALLMRRLDRAESATNQAVETLREARRQERKAKTMLDSISAAEEQFQKDGNWEAWNKSRDEAILKFNSNK